MKRFFSLVTLVALLSACEKKIERIIEDPAPEGTLIRTINYTNQNTVKTASYSGNLVVEAQAALEGNHILLGVFATPKVANTEGDGVAFKIDKVYLQQGLERTYNLDAQTAPAVVSARYNYMFQKAEGGFWSSIHETTTGLKMEGTLTITDYNAERKLISGAYNMIIKDLVNDPTQISNSNPIDPINLNTVTVNGTFTNLKLMAE